MEIWQAIILGLTQGASEFAPISSSGHLILVPWFFDWPLIGGDTDFAKTFDVALHMGTLLGALIYFRRDVWRYLRAWLGSIARRRIATPDERIAWALVVGTVPGVIVGALLEQLIQDNLGEPVLIAIMLAVFGVVLWWVDRVSSMRRGFDTIGPRTGLFLGTAQALALQPGVSRSGVTMTAARVLTFDRETAARFSFLLSLPVIAGAVLYKGLDLAGEGIPPGMGGPFVAGIAASAVSGFLVIAFLLRYLRVHDFALFLWIRVAVATLIFVVIATGARPATI